jgi:hypothetical protein
MSPIDVPAELVAELALGAEDPTVVAARYGIEGKRWEELQQWKPFLTAVDLQRAEFERSGFTFRVKSAMKADALADQVFVKAMLNETTLVQKMDALRLFSKLGDLEPNPKLTAPAGPTFSITIDMNNFRPAAAISSPKPDTSVPVEDAVQVTQPKVTLSVPDFTQ